MSDDDLKVVVLEEMCNGVGSTFADRMVARIRQMESEQSEKHVAILNWAKRLGARLAWVDFEMYNEWKSFMIKNGVK